MLNLFGNLIWLLFGGFFAAIGYFTGGLALCLTIVGIPWGLPCFKLGLLMFWPFGSKIVNTGASSGCLNLVCNIIWLFFGGLYAAFIHLAFGILLAITIIGLPFAKQHFKFVELALMPFGKSIQ